MTADARPVPVAAARPARYDFSGWRAWVAGFLAWTVLALLSALQNIVFLTSIGEQFRVAPIITRALADWYTCGLFTPVYFWLVRRYPIDRARWKSSVPLYLASTSVFVVLKYTLYLQVLRVILPALADRSLGDTLAGSFIFETIAFWCVLGVVHALVFYERFRDREVQAAELKAQLSAAQLDSLVAQLHPHFLFNTLQGVSTLMHRDPAGADTMLSRLSELLRRTLQRGDRQEVRLAEEMEVLSHYVGIIQVRFGDRLVFDTDIPGSVATALVPHFILQPLVENALQHGIARRAGAGHVRVSASREGDALSLRVTDDGPGLGSSSKAFPAGGIGLNNTRLRLVRLYGPHQRLTLAPVEGGGLRVELMLPYREEEA